MDARNIEDIYPLSPMQQGMLFHSLYAPESGVYFEQSNWTIRGDLNVPAFERAWQRVLNRHSAMRTGFVWEELDEPLQIVYRRVELPLEKQDWRRLSDAQQEAQLAAFIQSERERGFNLAKAPLIRLALLSTADDVHQFVWSHHHLLLDGWSLPLLLKEVVVFYEAFRQDQDVYLPPARPFRDYIAWLQEQDVVKAEAFWRRTLRGFAAPTPLIVDGLAARPEWTEVKEDYVLQRTLVPDKTTAALRSLVRKHQLTLNTLVQGAWALLLNCYSGEDDVVFGATVSGRPADMVRAESMVGLFINTLPVRVRVRPNASVLSWLKELQIQQAELRQYEYGPLVEIHGWSDVPRNLPLFESLLVFENYPLNDVLGEQSSSLEIRQGHHFTRTNYPLTVAVSPGREIGLEVAYDSRRFAASTIAQMIGHVPTLLEGMAADPEQPISALSVLSEPERQQLLVEWNATQTTFPVDQCVHEWFEAQVERSPDAMAVVFENQSLSYAELNRRANQLAHYLQQQGVGPEKLVGICVERSPEMVVGLLGVLKAGGAYVPLDPDYPVERLAFMLEDTQVSVLLTQVCLKERLPEHGAQVVWLDADWDSIAEESHERGKKNPSSGVTPENLAYVIYTSGSTGRPKGTLLRHKGLCNFANAFIRDMGIGEGSRVLQFASFGFDASVAEIFMALLSGGTLYLVRRETLLSVPDLVELLQENRITVATLPPSMLRVLPAEDLPALDTVISVGEACPPDIAARWTPGRRFFNGYGPTETAIGVTWGLIEGAGEGMTSVPIGRAADNTQIYVLDKHLRPVPVGVPGEMYVGGVGLARGYLNRPELTAESFFPHPFGDEPGARLYKTGDLVRYLRDGRLEFVGRVDHQVKIRGFRIELGEIEAVLERHLAVRQAVAVARDAEHEPGEKYLVAYVVLEGEARLDVGELRGYLKQRLPTYMLPSTLMVLETLPLMPSGKVDRRALPVPEGGRWALQIPYVAPRTPVEEGLADIWAQVLRLDRVGVHDNFFELGGHSLLATQLISRAREVFRVELLLRDLFEAPTVVGLAMRVEQALRVDTGLETPPVEPVSRDEELPLSFAQQRLWFLDQLAPGNLFYNIPMAVRLTGELDVAALERTLNEVVCRHEALRTTFVTVDERPVQVIAPELILPLPVDDLTHLPENEREAAAQRLATEEAQQPFDLAQGPLLRARLLRLGEEEHIVVLTVHHIVSDGWSLGVLVQEVATLYAAFKAKEPSPLPELPIQYADFAHWQREWLQGEILEAQLAYWRQQLGGSAPILELPTDRPRPAMQTYQGATQTFSLPHSLSDSLKALTREQGATLFMTLLAAFQSLLYRYTGQEDITVGTPIANRNRAAIEGLIGFFVNTLVIRTDLSGDPTFEELLGRVREVALDAYAHQDLPFEVLVETLQPQRDLSYTPLFQVMFVMDTPPVEAIPLPELTLSPIEVQRGAATFDLTLSISDVPGGLGGYIEYNTDLFDRETIQRLVGHFEAMLEAVVDAPDKPISTLPILTQPEQHKMLVEWNATAVEFQRGACIHHLFETQVKARPGAVAATYQGQQLTYAELNRRTNQLAHYLQKLGVGPDTLVGISTLRSLEMVVGILGTLKAGGAYLPLDPFYPRERLAFMLGDSQVPVLLTQAHLEEWLPEHEARVVRLDADWTEIAQESTENPESEVAAENLAYVIYTSGSTGVPKGTMLQHQGLSNLTDVHRRNFGVGEGSRVLQFSPFSFDASVWETFMALRNGATLCLAPQEQLVPGSGLAQLLREAGITVVTLPPSVLAVLPAEELPELKTVISAGEACTAELVARWSPGRDFFNAYGPTETTVCPSMYRCQEDMVEVPPIGQPIANTELYILDKNMQPVPVGVPGELHVGGVGLARGYLKRPEMTAEKFVPNPFSQKAGSRLYKTGDLVRYRADGNIEFLGRIDHQVKVRGFRIELGEIEAVLGSHPEVQDGVVVVREDVPGDKRLVAYLVPRDGSEPTPGELRSYLKQKLPEYMVPSAFVTLEALPLSPSGKVDRGALPVPDKSRPELEQVYVAPRNEREQKLAEMCAELLGVERVGVYDNFFDLGGHSLLATQFISRLREAFRIELPLRILFESPTVAGLAEAIERTADSETVPQAPAIAPVSRETRRVKRSELSLDKSSSATRQSRGVQTEHK